MSSLADPLTSEITTKLVKITPNYHLTCLKIDLRACKKLRNIYLRKLMESWPEQLASEAFELRLAPTPPSSFILQKIYSSGAQPKKQGSLLHKLLVGL